MTTTPRADWRPGLRRYPFGAAAAPAGALWREDVRYEFTAPQIDLIESVADELHGMIRRAVGRVIAGKRLADLGIRPEAARVVEAAWAEHARPSGTNERGGLLAGRLTLAYDGRDSLKLLAAHYDAPDGLFVASVLQRTWREAQADRARQFNGLHEALIERWEELAGGDPARAAVHLACVPPDPMREGEVAYRAATAAEAGLRPFPVALQDVRWDGRHFRDGDGNAVVWLGKLYPWEALADDDIARNIRLGGMAVLEPAWAWVASNHGFLAHLWTFNPGHPNLCPASFEPADLDGGEIIAARSFFGLDHAATRLFERSGDDDPRVVAEAGGVDTPGGWVWLDMPAGFAADGMHAVVDAWVVGDKCLGMTVRESHEPIVGADAAIVPHLFR